MIEVAIFALGDFKVVLMNYEKYGTLSKYYFAKNTPCTSLAIATMDWGKKKKEL